MKRTSIGGRVYRDDTGGFWARPVVDGRPTWRKLEARDSQAARLEGAQLLASPVQLVVLIRDLISSYAEAGCPNRRLESNAGSPNAALLRHPGAFFGSRQVDSIGLADLPAYAQWRRSQGFARGTGERMMDLEISALSACLSWGVTTGSVGENRIRTGRPRFRSSRDVQHASSAMCSTGDEIHSIAGELFAKQDTEILGWQWLMLHLTGLRCNEILALRFDAAPGEPGYLLPDRLDVVRSKGGINPWVLMHPDLAEAIAAFKAWRKELGISDPRWFPVRQDALGIAIRRVTARLGLPRRTPHGARAYYATKWHRDGLSDSDVASMIGDQTVALIHRTYGRPRPGEPKLSFRPATEPPIWARWNLEPAPVNLVPFRPMEIATEPTPALVQHSAL